jgi:hypothetical protein
MMLARHAYREYVRAHSGKVHAYVIDGMGFSHPRTGVYQGAGDQNAKTTLDQVDE